MSLTKKWIFCAASMALLLGAGCNKKEEVKAQEEVAEVTKTAPTRHTDKKPKEFIKLLGRLTKIYMRIPSIITALVIPIAPGTEPINAFMSSTAVMPGLPLVPSDEVSETPSTKLFGSLMLLSSAG